MRPRCRVTSTARSPSLRLSRHRWMTASPGDVVTWIATSPRKKSPLASGLLIGGRVAVVLQASGAERAIELRADHVLHDGSGVVDAGLVFCRSSAWSRTSRTTRRRLREASRRIRKGFAAKKSWTRAIQKASIGVEIGAALGVELVQESDVFAHVADAAAAGASTLRRPARGRCRSVARSTARRLFRGREPGRRLRSTVGRCRAEAPSSRACWVITKATQSGPLPTKLSLLRESVQRFRPVPRHYAAFCSAIARRGSAQGYALRGIGRPGRRRRRRRGDRLRCSCRQRVLVGQSHQTRRLARRKQPRAHLPPSTTMMTGGWNRQRACAGSRRRRRNGFRPAAPSAGLVETRALVDGADQPAACARFALRLRAVHVAHHPEQAARLGRRVPSHAGRIVFDESAKVVFRVGAGGSDHQIQASSDRRDSFW